MRSNDSDGRLFDIDGHRHPAGRVRKGLDADVRRALEAGETLAAAGVAAARTLADQIDQLERQLRAPDTKPYARVPLAGLVREFNDTYERLFVAVQLVEDPLTRALADFAAADADRRADRATTPGDHT